MKFNHDELFWITNALNEVLNGPTAIGDWEFGTRMGGSMGDVRALLQRVNAEMEALGEGNPHQ